MIKSISLLVRKDGMTHAQFVKYWVDVHAPLALAVPGLRRYVQSHIVEEAGGYSDGGGRGRRYRRVLVRRS